MLLRNKLFRFAVVAIIALIIIFLLWPFVGPAYDRFLVGTSDKISSSEISLIEENHILLYQHGTKKGGIDSSYLHFGLILVTALTIATPGLKFWRRLKFIAIALVVVFAIHVVTLVALAGKEFSGGDFFAVLLLPIGCSLFPALVWGVLCLRHLQTLLYTPKKVKLQRKGQK